MATISTYTLWATYANHDGRTVRIVLNGKEVAKDALGKDTGGWDRDRQQPFEQCTVELNEGHNQMMVESTPKGPENKRTYGPLPHISDFKFEPSD